MKSFDSIWELRFIPLAARFYRNPYLLAIRRSFFKIMPFLLAVVFFDVTEILFLDPWGLLMGDPGLNLGYWITGGLTGDAYRQNGLIQMLQFCRPIIGFGYGIVSILLTISIAENLAELWQSDRTLTRFCAIAALLSLLPIAPDAQLALTDYFSERRFFSAIVIAFVAAWVFSRLSGLSFLLFRPPAGFPREFSKYLRLTLPVLLTLFCFFLLALLSAFLVRYTSSAAASLASLPVLQAPWFVLLYQFVVWLLWWFGLPGYSFTTIIQQTAYIPAQASNQLGNTSLVFTSGFFEAGILHVLGLLIAILVFSKHEIWRSIARFSLPAMLFNVQEVIMFGLPVILNPLFLIPYLAAPLANTLVGYFAITWGIVPIFRESIPWTMPFFLNGMLGTGSLMGGVLQLIWLILDIFIYAPFVITANMIDFKEEETEDAHHEDLHG